jgi:glucose/arabinose dehydrogenase
MASPTRRTWLLAALLVVSAVGAWRFRAGGHGVHGHFSLTSATAAEVADSLKGAPFSVKELARVPGPTAIAEPPAGPAGLWVASQPGRLMRIAGATPTVALDIESRVASGGEMGLLGLAFHPNWPADPRLFVNYTSTAGGQHSVVASFRTLDGGATVDPTSETLVIRYDQPYSNHNSGSLVFGADGMLYVAIGDGGAGGDPHGTGQDRSDLLGSILRLDVSVAPYRIPADNPFVRPDGTTEPGVRGEIWAFGVRNPWGMHVDGPTVWFSDVGQDAWEEVNRGVPGGNYGWNWKEGTHCFERAACAGAFVEPVAEYAHSEGRSVTGGVVFHDPAIPALDGKYVFADFVTGQFFAVPAAGGKMERVTGSPTHPSAFGRDRAGRVYMADYATGAILRFEPPVARK